MKQKIIAIYCGNSTKEEIQMIQTHFFDECIIWYSSKFNTERKYKEVIKNYIIVEEDNLFEGDNTVLDSIADISKVIRFNSPIEFLRHNKIKRIKTKL